MEKPIPVSLNPSKLQQSLHLTKNLTPFTIEYLPYKKRVLNNYMSHLIITPNFRCGCNLMLFFFLIFTALGYLFYEEADKLHDFKIRYDDLCADKRGTGLDCEISFTLTEDMENPKVYYRLNNFYQNHRSFQKYSNYQLRGEDTGIDICDPVETNRDMLEDPQKWDISPVFPLALQTAAKLD